MRTLITGYAGFIGSNLTRALLADMKEGDEIIGLDCHTYAARPLWVWQALGDLDNRFVETRIDLRNFRHLSSLINTNMPDRVYHLAAESHVCNSIKGPRAFAETNFMGTFNLLEALRQNCFTGRMVHVSTDEAFGQLGHDDTPFNERTAIAPTSPYSASKAASDLMVAAYVHTYGMDIMTTRCTNNYGPNQHSEKLIPRTIKNILAGMSVTLHGDGTNSRDWIHVDDHVDALRTVMAKGKAGELYCVGSGLEMPNHRTVEYVWTAACMESGKETPLQVHATDDRPTDDRRYAVMTHKLEALGWKPNRCKTYFTRRLRETVRWYLENAE